MRGSAAFAVASAAAAAAVAAGALVLLVGAEVAVGQCSPLPPIDSNTYCDQKRIGFSGHQLSLFNNLRGTGGALLTRTSGGWEATCEPTQPATPQYGSVTIDVPAGTTDVCVQLLVRPFFLARGAFEPHCLGGRNPVVRLSTASGTSWIEADLGVYADPPGDTGTPVLSSSAADSQSLAVISTESFIRENEPTYGEYRMLPYEVCFSASTFSLRTRSGLAASPTYSTGTQALTGTVGADLLAGPLRLEIGRDGSGNVAAIDVDEVSVWAGTARSEADLLESLQTKYADGEPNLLGYWDFDGSTNTASQPNVLSGGPAMTLMGAPTLIPHTQAAVIMERYIDRMTMSQAHSGDFTRAGIIPTGGAGDTATYTPGIDGSAPPGLRASFSGDTLLVPVSSDRSFCNPSMTTVSIPLTNGPDNNFNGMAVDFTFINDEGAPNTTGAFFTGPTSGSLANGTILMDTRGGVLTFEGTGFGVAGPLIAGESVAGPCVNASVAGNGLRVECDVPAGVGAGLTAQVSSLCGASPASIAYPVAYRAPVVLRVSLVAASEIEVLGDFFGPIETGITAELNVTTGEFAGTLQPCVVQSADFVPHTLFRCGLQVNVAAEDVAASALSVTVGGQTWVGGANAIVPAPPSPQAPVADASPGLEDNPVVIPAVLGAAGLLVCVIVVLVVLLIIRRRRQAQQTAPFIPVHKKDFTPIIFGGDFELPSAADVKAAGDLGALADLLCERDEESGRFALASELIEATAITEADKISRALVLVFESRGVTVEVMCQLIADEVAANSAAGTLFRSNSMASKMFKFYSRIVGLPYLYMTAAPTIVQLVWENKGLEVDPERLDEGADLNEMRWLLMAQCQSVLKAVLGSAGSCPAQFRTLFSAIKAAVEPKFPEATRKTIGGFLFLRFFCPAVTSPESYGILDEPPSADARRLLILMTKVLQNLSNDVEFGSKEPYMAKMNDFIESNREALAGFFDEVAKEGGEEAPAPAADSSLTNGALVDLATHLRDNVDQFDDSALAARVTEIVGRD